MSYLTAEKRDVAAPTEADCNTTARRPQTRALVPVSPGSGTTSEERVARQKALFVDKTWQLARAKKLPLRDATALIASRTDLFPDLLTAGKQGRSLIAGKAAWHNYRSWAAKLGKRGDGSRAPDTANWRALLPRYRGSRKYVRPGSDAFWTVFANLYENENRLSMRYAYNMARLACPQGSPDGAIPSYGAVRWHYDNHVDRKSVYIARHGEEAYRNDIAGYITRAAPGVDECWFSDHHIFDAAARVWDPERGKWAAVRPWLTAWMDWGSLYFTGFQIRALAPNRDAIERSLRSAVEKNAGVAPLHVYIDNGKDYKAMGFSRPILRKTDEQRVASVCDALGSRVHFAIPYNARAKVIERIFGIVCGQFSKL